MRWTRTHAIALGLGLAASAGVTGLELVGALGGLEAGALDLAMWLRGPREPVTEPVTEPATEPATAAKVAVVAIDPASIDEQGRWPWSRSEVARLVRTIHEAGAAVLAIDSVFSERTELPPDCATTRLCGIPDPDPTVCRLPAPDCELAEAVAEAGPVVLSYYSRNEAVQHKEPFDILQLRGFRLEYDRSRGDDSRAAGGPPDFPLVPVWADVEANLLCFDDAAAANGFVSHPRTRGVFRDYRLVARHRDYESYYFPPLALAAVAQYRRQPLILRPHQGSLPGIYLGEERIPTDEFGRLRIDYLGPAGTFPTVSALEVLAESGTADTAAGGSVHEVLDGALVFLGVTETGVGDLHPTPFDELMPGVEIHATVAYNLLTGRYIHDTAVQRGVSLLAVLLLGPWVALLVSGIERYLVGSLVAIGLVLVWPVVAFGVFLQLRWHLLFVAPVLAGVLSLVATLRYQIGWVDRQARLFEGYISRNVRRELRRAPELVRRSEQRELTVLFSDIRGFSSRTEDMRSDRVVQLLNDFFTPMTRVVLEEDGTLDKYMGDALMAFFGAPVPQPDHARRACRAALRMRQELEVLRRSRQGLEELDIGIGLNSGEMTVGDMGSEGLFDYTVIGRNVNLGQRLEAATKPVPDGFGVGIILSEATRRDAGDGFLFRPLGRLQAKGFEQPVTIYELIAERPEPGLEPPGWTEPAFVRRFEEAYTLYYPGRDFAAAEKAFRVLAEERPDDPPTRYFLRRCREHRHHPPPPDWEGVEEQTKK